ncbi:MULTISPECIES: hypothetical protein [Streptosporangium]|uniref:Uncharacterized protein n=1 Tax=Streptosporangium brasiliense TaxID=47480 RepID=A0ABT9RM13_9ACTN|nr:hypothetical protein [Streptosporangium brasiliense]MDP9870312.1 hypothetical protein [Streptosporangium brasiliense]
MPTLMTRTVMPELGDSKDPVSPPTGGPRRAPRARGNKRAGQEGAGPGEPETAATAPADKPRTTRARRQTSASPAATGGKSTGKPAADKPASGKQPSARRRPEPVASISAEERAAARAELIEDGLRKKPTSVTISNRLLERAKAAVYGAGAKAYVAGEDYDGPASFAQLVEFGIADWVLDLERRFNDGKPFPTVYRLPPGPSAVGAQRGAALRKAKRQAAAEADGEEE